jgi:amino acid permease
MLNALLMIVSWWLALWDLRNEHIWTMPTVLTFFAMACSLYVVARVVSPPIAPEGPVDLQAYHREEGWKYIVASTAIVVLNIVVIYVYGSATENWVAENESNWPALAAGVAAAVSRNRWVQIAAVLVMAAMWGWYFATLQGALVDSP